MQHTIGLRPDLAAVVVLHGPAAATVQEADDVSVAVDGAGDAVRVRHGDGRGGVADCQLPRHRSAGEGEIGGRIEVAGVVKHRLATAGREVHNDAASCAAVFKDAKRVADDIYSDSIATFGADAQAGGHGDLARERSASQRRLLGVQFVQRRLHISGRNIASRGEWRIRRADAEVGPRRRRIGRTCATSRHGTGCIEIRDKIVYRGVISRALDGCSRDNAG